MYFKKNIILFIILLVILSGCDLTKQTDGGVTFQSSNQSNTQTQSITNSEPIESIPVTPGNLTATAVSSNQINLNWTDLSTNETGFVIERATDVAFALNFNSVTLSTANLSNYNVTGLSQSTKYYFRIKAMNSAGVSAFSISANATTQTVVTAPVAPTNLNASVVSTTQINLSWTDNSNNETGFKIDRATDAGFTQNLVTSLVANANTNSYSVTGLTQNTLYYFRVRATNAIGDSTNSNSTSATTQTAVIVPATPTNLMGTAISTSQINLTWTDNSNNESNFILERSTSSTFSNITTTTIGANLTSTSVTGLTQSTTYYFRIKASNSAGSSANSNVANIATLTPTPTPTDTPMPPFTPNTIVNTVATKNAIFLSASVLKNPPQIRIQWDNVTGVTRTSVSISRKSVGATTWGTPVSATATSNTWTDTNVVVGQVYEYKVTISSTNQGTGTNYIATGIEVPVTDYNGKILLVVDSSLEPSISTQLTTLENDLLGSGWIPIRRSVSRSATPASVRNLLIADYNSDPTQIRAAFIVGHVPVPYTAGVNPDGHGTNSWPADAYYADLTGTWSGNDTNLQTNIPSTVELQLGRITTAGMSAFPGTEVQQMITYLNKLHNFKIKGFTPQNKGLFIDNFNGSDYATNGLRTMTSSIGSQNISIQTPLSNASGRNCPASAHPALSSQSYLWGYTCGGGGGDSMSGVSCVDQMDEINLGSVFNMAFGSYFGNWNGGNSYLRTYTMSGNGLTVAWAGTVNWWNHHMAIGRNVGYGALLTMNNKIINTYTPERATSWAGDGYNSYVSLLGDPTLTAIQVAPPSGLVVSNVSNQFKFTWNSSSESGLIGYHIYEITNSQITRITSVPVSGNSYQSSVAYSNGRKFMVRAVKLQTTPSGSYFNMSLGALSP